MAVTQTILLQKNERYFTHNKHQAIWISQGGVCVYIIKWDKKTQSAVEQFVRLMDVTVANRVLIPAFEYIDARREEWRFVITATEPGTVLSVRDDAATEVLRRNFLASAGITTYEQEGGSLNGFENSLIAFYNKRRAMDSNIIRISEADAPKVRETVFEHIKSGVNETEKPHDREKNSIYGAVKYACQKCGIQNLASEEELIRDLGKQELSVNDIAVACKFISRKALLDEKWYESDCGTMVAQMVYEKKNAQGKITAIRYPAVLFRKKNRYWLYNTHTQEESPVTKDMMGNIDPNVYLIGRAFPSRSLTRKDILTFVKKSFRVSELIWFAALSLIGTLIGVLIPKLNQLIYDDYIPLGDMNVLTQICLVVAAFMIGNVFMSIVKNLYGCIIPSRAGYEVQDALYHRLFSLKESFFRNIESADLAQRIMGVSGIVNSIVKMLIGNGLSLVLGLIYVVQISRLSGKMAIAALLMLSAYAAIIFFLSLKNAKYAKAVSESSGEASGKLYQYITGIDKIRMAGSEERAILKYIEPVVRGKKISIQANRLSEVTDILIDIGGSVFSMILYLIIIKSNIRISTGAFIAFTTAFGALNDIFMGCVQAIVDYLTMKPDIERVKSVFTEEPEDNEDKEVVTGLKGEISVENVTFSYNPDQTPILNNISLHIRPGEYLAVVGPSGSGKSTLLKLLLGFETPVNGRIAYDGKDIKSVDKHSLRRNLGVVLQNGKLIAGSIFENITITSSEPDTAKVFRTIEDVGLKADIDQMPMGIHTVLGESGGTISGGQQQRILIARAIYHDPAVLFFDEATSALDNLTQAKVCESLEKRNMTRVVIAHRLSTVKDCDRIIVLDRGTIIEEGNYDALMEQKGYFYQMASRQII